MKNIDEVIHSGKMAAASQCQLELLARELIEISERSPDKNMAIQQAYWAGLAVGIGSGGKEKNVPSDIH